MSEVSKINSAIRSFLAENQSLKNLPKIEIISIMTARGIISHTDAAQYLKNSTFDTGYSNNIDIIPQWQGQKTAIDDSLNILAETVQNALTKLDNQNKTEGAISKTINFLKETFDTENKKSNTENLITETENQLAELEQSASPEEFKAKFKKFRGVEFSPAKIAAFKEKSEEMNRTQSIKDSVDNLKTNLDISTVNNSSNTGFRDANRAILKTFNTLGIKNKNGINKILKDIETAHKDNEQIKKYGGDFRISKNKKGEYTIYRTDKNGFPSEATMEELQIIAEEMKLRLNRAYGSALGAELPENATNAEIEKITSKKYNEINKEYQTAFKEAYGDKNLETLANNYIQSQKENTAYVQTALDIASMATMFLGSGAILKGASLLTKGNTTLKTLSAATNIATKITPATVAVQITRPIELVENLTAKEPDWSSYGLSIKEGAMWMALGLATGAVGDKARMFLGQKGLSSVAKNTGKSIEQLITMYKSGHKLPANLHRSLSLIENTAKISGTSAEFTVDILTTYAIQKARGEDVTLSDYIMSANGAIMGTVMHMTFTKISDGEKVKIIQKSLLETNPKISKKELEKSSQQLLELHRLAEEKRNPKLSNESPLQKTKISEIDENSIQLTNKIQSADGKIKYELNEAGEKKARAAANEIHEKAKKTETAILKIMDNAGLGTAGVNMTHRPKSAQSLYDKIKNALCDPKRPSTLNDVLKSIRDAVGTRTELADFDYKKHPDIVEMYKKNPEKAIHMAAERQSEEYVQKVKEIIMNSVYDPAAQLEAIRISNDMGKNGIPYFSEKQVAILQDYAAQYGIDLHVKNELTKVRASGYTALQMNFKTKDGFTFEWQLRGSKVNKFAECEHVPYDIRENKDVTGGREILKSLYAPIEETVKGLKPKEFDKYNEYLTAHYEHLRKQELGFESTPPKLEDYGLNDTKLKAENLELLHDLSDSLKKGEIGEYEAVGIYLAKTAKKINIPFVKFRAPNEKFAGTDDAFTNIIKNRESDFKALSKIENIDEFIQKGAALILDEMGLTGVPIKIEITDNLNEFSMTKATLRISRNWTGLENGHVNGKGNRAEILGGIAHELNHYLQNKEIYPNAMLREDEFKYNPGITDECQNLLLWGLGADDTGSAKFPYPMEQSDFYFQKGNNYLNNFMNYIEPYKMVENADGTKSYAKGADGNYIIDEKAYEAYLKQLVEAESLRRGDIVRDEYKKLLE